MTRRIRAFACTPFRLSLLLPGLLMLASPSRQVIAATQLLVATGQVQPGGGTAELLSVAGATLNDAGEVAFRATLKQDVGGINSSNDLAIWRTDGTSHSLVAQIGVTAAPGGGVFSNFLSASIGEAGEIAIRGASIGANGVWRYPPSGAGALVAATGVFGVPGLPLNSLDSISPTLFHAPGDVMAFNGVLASGAGVSTANDRIIWIDASGESFLVAREQVSPVPGIAGAQFAAATPLGVNSDSQVLLLGAMSVGVGGINSESSQAIFRISPSGGDLIAQRSVGEVAGAPGAHYSSLNSGAINGEGQVAFVAQLALSEEVTEANRYGLWRSDGTTAELVARSGTIAPGVAGAPFEQFGTPLLNDAGASLIDATLIVGEGGVTSANAEGLWIFQPGGGSLLARTGSGGVPGAAAASFAGFGAFAINADGVAAVQATLVAGVGGVSESNDQGIWLLNSSGGGVLVAREGDALEGRIIESLEFTGGSAGGDGRARSLNNSGQLVFKAAFTNGDEGLFLYSPSAGPTAPADFTGDGLVDGADLLRWKNNFGMSTGAGRPQGDADEDGDVDGGDFLLWQRQLGPNAGATPIPEPSLFALLLPAGLAGILRLKREGDRASRADCIGT